MKTKITLILALIVFNLAYTQENQYNIDAKKTLDSLQSLFNNKSKFLEEKKRI